MSVSVNYGTTLTVVETLESGIPDVAAAKAKITHDAWNKSVTLGAATTPPATKAVGFQQALSTGAATIDLAALPGTNGATVDGTGLRVQAMKVANPATNANPITIAKGASNGYDGFGADFSLTLAPGAEALLLPNDAGSDIASGKKTLDLAGTGAQALNVQIVLG